MDSIVGCGPTDLGSIPSVSTNLGDKMKMKIKNKMQACKIDEDTVSMNGIGPFCEHPRKENCWIYKGRMPVSNCCVTIEENYVEISNFKVHLPSKRQSGHGSNMVEDIRKAFPNYIIWVDTWNCSRGFWEKMKERGKIDIIANDYPWPCINTTCKVCHSDRKVPTRRFFE